MQPRSIVLATAFAAGLSGFGAAAHGNTLAITEFMSDGYGGDGLTEWVEVYNYGPDAVNTAGWTVAHDGGSADLADYTVGSGEYFILARDKAFFEERWGLSGDQVMPSSFALNNGGNEEIVLTNAEGEVVWNLAYADSVESYRGTFLTDEGFGITDYGRDEDGQRLVNFDGVDGTGTLGYESNAFTEDAFAVTNAGSDFNEVGSPLAGGYAVIPEPTSLALIAAGGLLLGGRRRRA